MTGPEGKVWVVLRPERFLAEKARRGKRSQFEVKVRGRGWRWAEGPGPASTPWKEMWFLCAKMAGKKYGVSGPYKDRANKPGCTHEVGSAVPFWVLSCHSRLITTTPQKTMVVYLCPHFKLEE